MFKEAILCLILILVACDDTNSGTRILSIGYGSFLIILSIIIALFICIFAQTTSHP